MAEHKPGHFTRHTKRRIRAAIKAAKGPGLKKAAEHARNRMRRYVKEEGAYFSGRLYNETKTWSHVKGSIKVGARTPYAHFVEYGMPPGTKLNMRKLKAWWEAKGLDELDVPLARLAASLSRKGYEGRLVFLRAWYDSQHHALKLISREVSNAYRDA